MRPIYEDAELAKLFRACSPSEEVRFKFYLISGFRDAEGRFVTWRDVDFKHLAVPRHHKTALGISSEELGRTRSPGPAKAHCDASEIPARKTPVPDDPLVSERHRETRRRNARKTQGRGAHVPSSTAVIALSNTSWRTARSKINRCADGPYCAVGSSTNSATLMRRRHLQDGIDIRTLQQWMGHRDIASTMVYLKGVRNSDVQARESTRGASQRLLTSADVGVPHVLGRCRSRCPT